MQTSKNAFTLMLSFLKLGVIGFGGGAALIPVIEQEVVGNKKWVDKERFDLSVAIASVAPASHPVSLSTTLDMRYSLLCAYSYALPGSLIYLILLTGFTFIGEAGTKYLSYASVGLIAFVLFLLYRFIRRNYARGVRAGMKKQYLLIMAGAFLLTCENAIGKLAAMLFGVRLPTPVFAIDMIILILAMVFIIVFAGASKSKAKFIIAFLLAALFALANGKAGILREWVFPISVVMLVSAVASITYDYAKEKKEARTEKKLLRMDFKPLRNLLLFITVAAAIAAVTYIASGDANTWSFALKVITSALSSFGGGEAYIGVSEAVFVQTGFIPESIYNTQIIGIANTMPGPVLMAIVTGVGYTYGSLLYGVGFGWIFGLMGFSMAVTATAFGALTMFIFFDILKDSVRLKMIIRNIMPVVCGMLISTALSLLRQASSVLIEQNINAFLSIGIVLGIVMLMLFLHKRCRMHDLALLLFGGAGTITALGVLDYLI